MSGGAEMSQQTVSFNPVMVSCGMDDLSVHIIKYAVWNVDLRGGSERSEILRVDTTVTCLFNVHLIKSKRGIWSDTSPFYVLNCQGRCKRLFCFTLWPIRCRRYRLKCITIILWEEICDNVHDIEIRTQSFIGTCSLQAVAFISGKKVNVIFQSSFFNELFAIEQRTAHLKCNCIVSRCQQ